MAFNITDDIIQQFHLFSNGQRKISPVTLTLQHEICGLISKEDILIQQLNTNSGGGYTSHKLQIKC